MDKAQLTSDQIENKSSHETKHDEKSNNDNNIHNLQSNEETSMMDSSWSWVVLAVCMLGTTAMGSSYVLFGLIYQDLIEEFQSTSATVGWVGSLYIGCGNLMGIVCGLAVERVGCRIVCILGSLLCTAGFFLSFFATSVIYLYVTYGIMAGTGLCMIVSTCFVNVMRHFKKKRPIAGAMCSTGYSIGSVLIGPVMRYIFEIFSWRGSLVIFSCLTLQMAAASAFAFGPPVIFKKSKHNYRLVSSDETRGEKSEEIESKVIAKETNLLQNDTKIFKVTENFQDDRIFNVHEENTLPKMTKSSIDIISTLDPHKNAHFTDFVPINKKSKSVDHDFPIKRNLFETKFAAINIDQGVIVVNSDEMLNAANSSIKNVNYPDEAFEKESFKQILSDPPVFFYLLGCLFMYTGIQVYVHHFPSRAYTLGVDRTLINYLPITYNAVAGIMKIISGFVANRPKVNRLLLFSTSVLGVGLTQMSLPLFDTFAMMMLHGCLCGLFTGVLFCLYLTLMVDLKGVPNVTKTTPMVTFCFGVAALFGTPFAGFLFDVTNDYDMTFIITSALIIVGSAWCFLSVYLNARKNQKRGFK